MYWLGLCNNYQNNNLKQSIRSFYQELVTTSNNINTSVILYTSVLFYFTTRTGTKKKHLLHNIKNFLSFLFFTIIIIIFFRLTTIDMSSFEYCHKLFTFFFYTFQIINNFFMICYISRCLIILTIRINSI